MTGTSKTKNSSDIKTEPFLNLGSHSAALRDAITRVRDKDCNWKVLEVRCGLSLHQFSLRSLESWSRPTQVMIVDSSQFYLSKSLFLSIVESSPSPRRKQSWEEKRSLL